MSVEYFAQEDMADILYWMYECDVAFMTMASTSSAVYDCPAGALWGYRHRA